MLCGKNMPHTTYLGKNFLPSHTARVRTMGALQRAGGRLDCMTRGQELDVPPRQATSKSGRAASTTVKRVSISSDSTAGLPLMRSTCPYSHQCLPPTKGP